MSRSFTRSVLHLLRVTSLVLPAIAAPAQATTAALQARAAASFVSASTAVDAMPCHGEGVPTSESDSPSDFCPQSVCSLSGNRVVVPITAAAHAPDHAPAR